MSGHACEICGQAGLTEAALRAHMEAEHVSDTSAACPFCDLAGLAPDDMAYHVSTAHAERAGLDGEEEEESAFLEGEQFGKDLGTVWSLEAGAREGLTNGVDRSPAVDEVREWAAPPKPEAQSASADSPMSTGTDFSSVSSASTVRPPSVSSSSSSPVGQRHQGAIKKRPRASLAGGGTTMRPAKSSSTGSPRSRKGMTLDVVPAAAAFLTCPMCPHREPNPERLQEHVNRKHFDLASPAEGGLEGGGAGPSKFSCPLCPAQFPAASQLERHVEADHGDVLSPAGRSRREDVENGNLECPVCSQSGFINQNLLAKHVESHFSPDDDGASDRDLVLAQELDRREREARRHQEQREFDRLRAQYGMDGQGNYGRQADQALQREARRGSLSVVDYHEKKIDVRLAEVTGADEGTTVTRNPLPLLRRAAGGNSQNPHGPRVFLATQPVDHYSADRGDAGWGCGYRNLQMLLSCLAAHEPYAAKLRAAGVLRAADSRGQPPSSSNLGSVQRHPRLPSIPKLQSLIEEAWSAGFDPPGRAQLGGSLSGSRKWIGSTEIAALLRHAGVRARVVDFHRPTAADGTHPALFDWVAEYFASRDGGLAPPLYFQHEGHSRTIVGAEKLPSGASRLLVFDPSHKKAHMARARTGQAGAQAVLQSVRKTRSGVKHRQYQIVLVAGVYDSAAEAASGKTIHPDRVPA